MIDGIDILKFKGSLLQLHHTGFYYGKIENIIDNRDLEEVFSIDSKNEIAIQ